MMWCSFFFLFMATGQAQLFANFKQDEEKIKVNFENATVEEVFTEIENRTDFRFSFDRAILDPSVRITYKGKTQVTKLLRIVSRDARLEFRRINDNIHVRKPTVVPVTRPPVSETLLERTISGTITDETGQGLPGASVYLEGTTSGTVTDVEGKYTLNVPDQGGVLIISFVGYQSERIVIGSQNVIDVSLTPDIQALTEVVVIGYGTREKKDVTGAIATVDQEAIDKTQGLTAELAMQGRMAGVFVSNPGGDPTSRPDIRIRGVGSFNNNDPLYVIDGVPITEFGATNLTATISEDRARDIRGPVNIMNLINPNDIESISVLKDAAASAIYGSRAANGVILITTKGGNAGKPKLEFNASFGFKSIPDTYDVLDTRGYVDLVQDIYSNAGATDQLDPRFVDSDPLFLGNSPTYDWQDAISVDNAYTQRYGMNITGGNDYSTYYAGVGYSYDEGTLIFNETERISLTLNSDHKINNWLKIGQTARLAYLDVFDQPNGADFDNVIRTPPWQPITLANGSFAPIRDPDADSLLYGPGTRTNYLGVSDQQDWTYEYWRFLGSGYIEIEPIKDLKVRGAMSFDWNLNVRQQFIDFDRRFFREGGATANDRDRFEQRDSQNRNLLKEITVSYNRSIGVHSFDALFNASQQTFLAEGIAALDSDLPNADREEFRFVRPGAGDSRGVNGWREEGALIGYVGRLSYNYDSKYYLDVALRRDGSSNFNEGYQWGTFPSVSGAWRLYAENFMGNISFVNDLKLRGGWGQLGNQNVTPFSYVATVDQRPVYGLGNGNGSEGILYGASYVNFPTENLGWETTTTTSLALDGVLFNNLLDFSIEYYSRVTDDIIQQADLPLNTGAVTTVPFNIGKMENRGIELTLNASKSFGDFQVNVGGNLTTVRNRVLEIYEGVALNSDFNQNDNLIRVRTEVDQPFEYIYGFRTDGIYQNEDEVDADNEQYREDRDIAAGDIRFMNVNTSNPDGTISSGADSLLNEADRVFLGKTIPGYYYGFNIGMNYKKFDLSIFFRGVGDVQRINEIRRVGEAMDNESNQLSSVNNRWTPENRSNSMPRAVLGDPADNARISDRWVEDAGFLRLQNIQLGYTFPPALLDKASISSLRVFAGVDNLFVITDYSGVDPEDDNNPPARTILFGLNVSF